MTVAYEDLRGDVPAKDVRTGQHATASALITVLTLSGH